MDEGKNIFDYLIVITKRKKFILITFFSTVVITVILSLILPKYYRAEAILMPPAEDRGFNISSLLSNFSGLSSKVSFPLGGGLSVGGINISQSPEKTKRLIAILESRTLMEKVVNNFNLIESYKVKNMTEAIKELRDFITFQIEESGAISIFAVDKSRKKASEMANYLISELEKMNVELNIENARNNRIFIEDRYNQNKKELAEAEEKYREFQKTHNVISLPEQIEAAIVAAANLSSEISQREIELGIKEKRFGKNHSEILSLKSELSEYKKKLNKLFIESENPSKSDAENRLYIPFSKTSEIGIEFIRIERELEIQNSIFEMLTTLYEQAKIEEAQDTPTIQVLDKAIPPEKKYKPKRMLLVAIWSGVALILSIILAFLFDYMERASSTGKKTLKRPIN
ncbi:GumC family protein [candidate division KSB1 bacterium]